MFLSFVVVVVFYRYDVITLLRVNEGAAERRFLRYCRCSAWGPLVFPLSGNALYIGVSENCWLGEAKSENTIEGFVVSLHREKDESLSTQAFL
jgi:hypothetical protein